MSFSHILWTSTGGKTPGTFDFKCKLSFVCVRFYFATRLRTLKEGFMIVGCNCAQLGPDIANIAKIAKTRKKNKSSLPRILSALSMPAADFYRIRAVVESREINITAIALLLARARNGVIISCPTWGKSKGGERLGRKMDSNDKR